MAVLKIRGKDGNITDILSIKGENGNQMFVRFSAYADGTDMSERWDAERDYMGIAFAATAPTDKAAYQWLQLASLSFGRYAEEGSAEKYLFFIGNGTGEDDRSNALTLDDEGNLHVMGEITLGEDNFSPRDEIGKKSDVGHTHKAQDVTDLSAFMENYKTARIVTGSYVGTGHTRPSDQEMFTENRVRLTFPFAPRYLVIQHFRRYWDGSVGNYGSYVTVHKTATLLPDVRAMQVVSSDGLVDTIDVSIADEAKTITWVLPSGWKDHSEAYLNRCDETYYYTAIG